MAAAPPKAENFQESASGINARPRPELQEVQLKPRRKSPPTAFHSSEAPQADEAVRRACEPRGTATRVDAANQSGAATRWYALRSIFAPADARGVRLHCPRFEQRPPILVVFSLAGGVGKTCLVATLGRVLSALGEHVLLAETAACGVLPFYFGSREMRPGVVRTFFPPGSFGEECDAPVQMLNLQGRAFPARR